MGEGSQIVIGTNNLVNHKRTEVVYGIPVIQLTDLATVSGVSLCYYRWMICAIVI